MSSATPSFDDALAGAACALDGAQAMATVAAASAEQVAGEPGERPRTLRVIVMGTPAYALGSLRALAAAEFVELAADVTRPDAVSGRGQKLIASPVKELATQLGVPVIETKSLRGDDVRARLHDIAPDVIAVTAFGAIVPDDLIALPKLACLNVHASLLPRWRGAAPMQRALLAGDERLGYSVMRIEHGLDTGAYCRQGSVWVGERTYPELSQELSRMGGEALVDVLHDLALGRELAWVEQDDNMACEAPKIDKAELRLSPELDASDNMRRIQASSDEAPARCIVAGRATRVLAAHVVRPDDGLPAVERGRAVVHQGRILLGCADGVLEVLAVKPDGKREMSAREFAAGIHGTDQGWEALS